MVPISLYSDHSIATETKRSRRHQINILQHMLHDASIDSSMNEAFLQHQCIMIWSKCRDSRFQIILHVLHLTKKPCSLPNRKTTQEYMLKPILLSAIPTIGSIQLSSSHSSSLMFEWGDLSFFIEWYYTYMIPNQNLSYLCHLHSFHGSGNLWGLANERTSHEIKDVYTDVNAHFPSSLTQELLVWNQEPMICEQTISFDTSRRTNYMFYLPCVVITNL